MSIQPELKGIHSLNIQEKGVDYLNIQAGRLCEHTGKRHSQSEHTKGGRGGVTVSTYKKRPFIVLTCIHEKGVYSLNIYKKGIHSRNMQESETE